jgi:formyl-CoA transferase
MGADVIKIEPPDGDASRRLGGGRGRERAAFWAVNRNKRGVVVDLKHPKGVEVCRRLAGRADILVENFRPGTLARLGLGFEDLHARAPGLVYASISGYGQTGPRAHRGGFDLVAQGESGIMSITGVPGGPPVKSGVPVCDLGAALLVTYGILSAYIHRLRTGAGQRVETSLLEAGIALSVWEATEYFTTGQPPEPTGSAHRLSAPYQAIRCQDGYITIGAANDRTWERLCRALGREDLLARPEFATNADRLAHREDLQGIIEALTVERPRAHWQRLLEDAGVPCGPINTYADVFADPQVLAREMLQGVEHRIGGTIRQIGPPVKCSRTPARIRRAAPLLGEHTEEVLLEAGYARAEIEAMAYEGVIALCPSL